MLSLLILVIHINDKILVRNTIIRKNIKPAGGH